MCVHYYHNAEGLHFSAFHFCSVDGSSVGTINLGLIEQFHYVALIHNEPHPEANATEIAQDEAAFEHACKEHHLKLV